MSNISFGNITAQKEYINPEIEKRNQSQENFGATIDKEKLKQDTVEIATKAEQQVKDNFVFRIMRNLGVKEPKKLLKSIAYTFIAVAGVAIFGNKMSNKFADLGLKADDMLQGDGFKWARNIGSKIKTTKTNVGKFLKSHSKTIDDITTTLKNPAKKLSAENPWAKAQCSGAKYQFASAVVESMQGIFYGWQKDVVNKNIKLVKGTNGKNFNFGFLLKLTKEIAMNFKNKADLTDLLSKSDTDLADLITQGKISQELLAFIKSIDLSDVNNSNFLDDIFANSQKDKTLLFKLLGDNSKAIEAYKGIIQDNLEDRVVFVEKFTKNIRKANGNADNKQLLALFKEIQNGEFANDERTKDILMYHGADNWYFTNKIDKLGHKIFGDKWKNVSRANLGSTLIKYNAVSGDLADSALGKFIQGFPTIFTESVSNHVCDMALMNMIVVPSFIGLFNNVQDAPKEQKGATLVNNFMSDVGRITIVTPAAAGITYGLASLKNLEGKGIISKCLKLVGKVVGFGLGNKNVNPTTFLGKAGKWLKGFVGGSFRLYLIMFALSGLISKPLEKLIAKIFGKPYDKEEVEKQKQLEEQKKQIIPELGITQGELMEKIEKNPQAMQRLQGDEKLAQTIAQNPKALLDLLDNKEVQYIEPKPTPASQGTILSPANKSKISNSTNAINKKQTKNKEEKQSPKTVYVDSATYIPSSDFIAPQSSLSPEQLSEYNSAMDRADKALKAAEKYI